MTKAFALCGCFFAWTVITLLFAGDAMAQGGPLEAFESIFGAQGDENRGISTVLVGTVREALTGETVRELYNAQLEAFEGAIGGMMMLAIIIFGARVVMNDFRHSTELRSGMFMLAIKLVLVNFFIFNMEDFMDLLLRIPEDLVVMAMGIIDFSESVGCSLGAPPGNEIRGATGEAAFSTAGEYGDVNELWWKIDCLFLNSFGITFAGAGISAGLGIMVSSTFSGLLGSYITYTGIAAFVGFLFAIMRVTYSYIVSMVIITFLLSLAPIFIPLILFKFTTSFFDKWLGLITGFMLQPMFVAIGLSFMILMFNYAVIESPNSLVNTLFPGEPGAETDASNWQELNDILYEQTLSASSLATDSGDTQCDSETDTDYFAEAGHTVNATERYGCNRGGDPTAFGPVSMIIPISQQTFNAFSENLGWIADGGGTGDPVQDAALAFEGMKSLILAYGAMLLVVFASYILIEEMDTLSTRLTNLNFRIEIPFDLPLEGQFNTALQTAQRTTNSVMQNSMPMGGMAGGMMTGQDGMETTMRAYQTGLAQGISTIPFIGEAASQAVAPAPVNTTTAPTAGDYESEDIQNELNEGNDQVAPVTTNSAATTTIDEGDISSDGDGQ